MLILIKYANRRYKFAFRTHPPHTAFIHTHTYTRTHVQTLRWMQSSNGRHVQPRPAERWITYGGALSQPWHPPIASYYVTVLSRYLCSRWQMQFVVCTRELLHCKLAIGNGWRALGDGQRAMAIAQLAAKNGCKDMIISNHLNNLLQAAARVRVHRAQWKY